MTPLPHLNPLVLRCRNIEATRDFYTRLGLSFRQEQHGTGPIHYSARLGSLLLELYPTQQEPDNTRLGFSFSPDQLQQCQLTDTAILLDPDGRKVEISIHTKTNN